MGSTEKFCLKWNDFETNISSAFRDLREEKDFFDVTLACDDSQVQAHKVILSACSPFFRQILRRNPHQHPLLYLKGVKYKELLSVLNFMYQGEVNVAQEELNSFLAVAEDLRVKGLTQNSSEPSDSNKGGKDMKQSSVRPREPPDRELPGAPPLKRPRPAAVIPPPSPLQQQQQQTTNNRHSSSFKQDRQEEVEEEEEDDIQEVLPVKSEPREAVIAANTAVAPLDSYQDSRTDQSGGGVGGGQLALDETYQDDSYDYGDYGEGYDDNSGMIDPNTGMPLAPGSDGNKDGGGVLEMVDAEGRRFVCSHCSHSSRHTRADIRKHIQAKHMSNIEVTCGICYKTCPNVLALKKHQQRHHRAQENSSF